MIMNVYFWLMSTKIGDVHSESQKMAVLEVLENSKFAQSGSAELIHVTSTMQNM